MTGLIDSAGRRATKTDKLTGTGVPRSIGALSVQILRAYGAQDDRLDAFRE